MRKKAKPTEKEKIKKLVSLTQKLYDAWRAEHQAHEHFRLCEKCTEPYASGCQMYVILNATAQDRTQEAIVFGLTSKLLRNK